VAPHLAVVNRALIELAARRIRFLMVFMPPRSGKSMLISQYFPGWWLGTFPEDRVILASYEAGYAATWGRKARDALDEFGPDVWGIRVNPLTSSASAWDVQRRAGGRWANTGGGMVTAGIGGAITGRGANLFIIDDPVKNQLEAQSKTYQERAIDWFRSVALPRLEPDGVMVLMMTRWHQNDLAGRILAEAAEDDHEWTVVRLPALAEEPEELPGWRREPGEALWPQRYPAERLQRIRQRIGPYWWAALYQQRPAPPEGNLFKRQWFQYFTEEPHGEDTLYLLHARDGTVKRVLASQCWRFQTCDPNALASEQSDWFALATWAVTPEGDLLLLDVFRTHAATTSHEQIMRQQYQRWQPAFQGVERAAFGLNIIQGAAKAGLPIKPLPAEGDKVARARTMAARYELGTVYHRRGAPWLGEWEEELAAFPNAEHDDQVDVAAYAGIELVHSLGLTDAVQVSVI
jgi:predicted phage terminase large subunit-like protein